MTFKNENGSNRTIAFSSIEVSGIPATFYNGQSTTLVILPIDPTTSETTFTFHHDGISEQLTVAYQNEIRVVSESCGAFLFQKNLEVERSDFNKVTVVQSRLLTNVSNNLDIF